MVAELNYRAHPSGLRYHLAAHNRARACREGPRRGSVFAMQHRQFPKAAQSALPTMTCVHRERSRQLLPACGCRVLPPLSHLHTKAAGCQQQLDADVLTAVSPHPSHGSRAVPPDSVGHLETLGAPDPALLLELGHDAIFARTLDDSRVLWWNQAAEQLYGWTEEEVLGQVSHDVLQTELPAPIGQIQAIVLQIQARSRPSCCFPYTNVNGSTFPAPDPSVQASAPVQGSPTYATDILTFTQQHAPNTFNGRATNYWNMFQAVRADPRTPAEIGKLAALFDEHGPAHFA